MSVAPTSLASVQATLEATFDGIVVTSPEPRITGYNQLFLKMWDLSEDLLKAGREQELMETLCLRVVEPEKFLQRIEQITRESPLESHDVLQLKDGRLLERLSKIQLVNGENAGRVWSFRDITENRRVETALRENQERLELVMKAAQMGDWEWVIATGKVRWSPSLEAIHGLPPGAFGGSFEDFKRDIHPDDLAMVLGKIQECLETQGDYHLEYRIIKPNGKTTWLEVRGRLLLDAVGKPERLVGVCMDVSGRKHVEEELRVSELFNRTIIENSRDCTKTLGLDGTILWISENGLRTLRIKDAREVLGRSWSSFWHGEERTRAEEAVATAAAGGTANFIGQLPNAETGVQWFEVVVSPILDANGQPERLLAVSRDITARRQAEEDLKFSETRFRELADSMPQIVWTARTDGFTDYYNRRWYEYTGLDPHPGGDESFTPVLHPDDIERTLETWYDCVATGSPYQIEYRFQRSDGEFRWFLSRALPVRDQAGNIVRWYGSSTDIHEQKLTAQALQEEYTITEQLHEVAKSLATELDLQNVVQLITDVGTRITRAQFGAFFYNVLDENGASYMLYTLSGVPKERFSSFPMPRATHLFGPTFVGEGVIRLDDVRKDPRFGRNSPYFGMPEGHLPVVSYLAVPVTSRHGQVLGGLFFGHEEAAVFTERDERIIVGIAAQAAAAMDTARIYQEEQKARAASEQASQAKDHFIAALSHELRTPLTPVMAILSGLREQTDLPRELADDLETIRRNVELEARLIDDLLDMTRIAKGKLELRQESVPIEGILEDAIKTSREELREKNLTLKVEHSEPPGAVQGDRARLTQILWNLIKNATKFTPAGEIITIRTSRSHGEGNAVGSLSIQVRDPGIGIEPERLENIFEAFEQGNSSVTRQFGGLGLGLAISKAIAESHGGTLTAASDGLGHGSTFTLLLPGTTPAPGPATGQGRATAGTAGASPSTGQKASASRKLRILLVEDHADSAAVLERVIRRMGHEVMHAATMAEALQLARREAAGAGLDLVISDLGLPDGSGLELMSTLSGEMDLAGIALSGYGMESDMANSRAAGFSSHLTKPVDVELIRKAIAEIADKVEGSAISS